MSDIGPNPYAEYIEHTFILRIINDAFPECALEILDKIRSGQENLRNYPAACLALALKYQELDLTQRFSTDSVGP